MVQAGQKAYEMRCSGCHGLQGDGNGPGAAMLDPKPRDFTKGVFKLKTGITGTMPSDNDLFKTINQGIPGTSMPSFVLVSEPEKRAIIEYLKTFAPDSWKNPVPAEALASLTLPRDVFTQKAKFLEYARTGRVWYQELGCVSCHGLSGRGDGTSAEALMDSWDQPIRPANFHRRFVKRGYTAEDIAASISQGIDGTPMPSYTGILEAQEAKFPEIKAKRFIWELTAYVLYLRGESMGIYPEGTIPPVPADRIPAEEVKAAVGKYFE